jgi:alpha-beta hydrolase superfamily lysophospholipase
MQHKEYYLKAKDGLNLFIRKWVPQSEYKALMILIHGFSEHSGRYIPWIKRFAEQGIRVYAMDIRGHGLSEGLRGHTPSYSHLLDDIDVCINHISNPRQLPIILYGQSLGGNLVINYALTRKNKVTGIISTSPWLRLVVKPKNIGILLSRILRKLFPSLIEGTKLDINLLSHDPQVAIDYEKDPLTHSIITPQLFFGTEKAAKKAIKNIHKLSLPLLLMHGTGDLVTSCKTSQKIAKKADNFNKNITFISWPDYFHELHNETGNEKVFESIMKWISKDILKT